MTLNEKLSPLLDKKGLTKDSFREKMNVSKSSFFKWLKQNVEKRTLEEISLMASILEISPNEILTEAYSPKVDEKVQQLEESLSVYKQLAESQKEQILLLKSKC